MNATDIIAMAKDRGFKVVKSNYNSEKLYIFRGRILMGYVIDVGIDYEKLDRVLTECSLETFE